MKFLRKINKGLVLSIIVLVAVAIYSINVETQRNKEKPSIKEKCEQFVALVDESIKLPEKYQKLNSSLTDEEQKDLEQYENIELNNKLKEKMIDKDAVVDIEKTIIASEYDDQLIEKKYIVEFKREITKISSYVFDGDQVTVTFDGKVDKKIKYSTLVLDEDGNEKNKEETKTSSFNTKGETITLQKVDNEWKIVYADLSFEDYGNMGFGMGLM